MSSLRARISRLYHTLRPLRAEQWWFRCWHPIKRRLYVPPRLRERAVIATKSFPVIHHDFPAPEHLFQPFLKTFSFLNVTHKFDDALDWDYRRFGLLWTYHLNYFDWLGDNRFPMPLHLQYMQDHAEHCGKVSLVSYPASRRIVNWVRFSSRHHIMDDQVQRKLYQDSFRLAAFPERHLLGNHLWENACALFCAGLFFYERALFVKGAMLLQRVLAEQLLPDGGHYERSPSYHALLLQRLLGVYQLYRLSQRYWRPALAEILRSRISRMLGWMDAVAFSDDTLPQVNDVAPEQLPELEDYHRFAKHLGIEPYRVYLRESGFRKIDTAGLEMFVNVGNVLAGHQPGHAHADTLSFILYQAGWPVIIDPGTSTYEQGAVRDFERSTAAHNTVNIAGANSSDVWAAFRMGRRARITDLQEATGLLEAAHDGYRKTYGSVHRRRWEWIDGYFCITDWLEGGAGEGEMRLHFHPDIALVWDKWERMYTTGTLKIEIVGADRISLQTFEQPQAFGQYRTGLVLLCSFRQKITTIIYQELHAD